MICSIHNCHEIPAIVVVIDMDGVIGHTIKVNLCEEHAHLENKIIIKKENAHGFGQRIESIGR